MRGKPQGVTAFVALRFLNVVESHFDDDAGLNFPQATQIFGGVLQKIFSASLDFRVSQSGIGFADGQKLAAIAN